MTAKKLRLDVAKIEAARSAARTIALDVQSFVDQHTTVSVERAVLRLLGIDGVDAYGVPLPNRVLEQVCRGGGLSRGASYYVANAMLWSGQNAQQIAAATASGDLDLLQLPQQEPAAVRQLQDQLAAQALQQIARQRQIRTQLLRQWGEGQQPWLYVIVATGNIYEDVVQAKAAARAGADIIAVIRSTCQSLLDYVPYGPTTEGFGGTYATQANFAIMRQALDEVSQAEGRYIRLVNYCSGLCMPEIAAMGALERLDMMLNDALYGILFRDINMQRTLVDQYFPVSQRLRRHHYQYWRGQLPDDGRRRGSRSHRIGFPVHQRTAGSAGRPEPGAAGPGPCLRDRPGAGRQPVAGAGASGHGAPDLPPGYP